MPLKHFTSIGIQIGGSFKFFAVIAAVGLIIAIVQRKNRWTGISIVISAFIGLLPMPSPFFFGLFIVALVSGTIADLAGKRISEPLVWRKGLRNNILLGVFYLSLFVSLLTRMSWQEIMLYGNRVVSNASFHKTLTANRSELTGLELIGWDGTVCAWRFGKQTKGAGHPFVTSTFDTEMFWDHAGHIVTGKQVADHIAKWAGVKYHREPYAVVTDDEEARRSLQRADQSSDRAKTKLAR